MQDRLPALAESLDAAAGRLLIQQKIEQRATMATLCMQDIDARAIAIFTGRDPKTVRRWECRVEEGQSLCDRARSGRPRSFADAARLATIAVYCQHAPPLPGVHSWSLRDAQRYFKEHPEAIGGAMSRATIQRVLLEHFMRPHRRQYYLQITDPDFFPKMDHIVGLYINPPEHLYCFDECTCIQALNRLTPNLPPAPGLPLLEDFDYKRNGITDLMAFLNPTTGKVYGQCVPDHNRHTFCRVFRDHVGTLPPDATVHYITDNLTTHYHDDFCRTVADLCGISYSPLASGTQRREWLQSDDKRIVVHFTPFHASWLNMVEIWFGILKRKCLKYGHFFSVEQLREDILAFIETWNECFAHPFSWGYTGEGLHAKAVRRFCRLLAIETDQMECCFLKSQLLLMSNIAESYIELVPQKDWLQLVRLAVEKEHYMNNIIETDTGPRRNEQARLAYDQFVQAVINRKEPLAKTG